MLGLPRCLVVCHEEALRSLGSSVKPRPCIGPAPASPLSRHHCRTCERMGLRNPVVAPRPSSRTPLAAIRDRNRRRRSTMIRQHFRMTVTEPVNRIWYDLKLMRCAERSENAHEDADDQERKADHPERQGFEFAFVNVSRGSTTASSQEAARRPDTAKRIHQKPRATGPKTARRQVALPFRSQINQATPLKTRRAMPTSAMYHI